MLVDNANSSSSISFLSILNALKCVAGDREREIDYASSLACNCA